MIQRAAAWVARGLRFGRGRPVAILLLLATLSLNLPEHSPLEVARHALFDAYQTYLPRERLSGPVTIIGIDEHSLRALGQWPWPRSRLAAMIERIAALRPLAIGLDIIMPEHDATSPEALARTLPPGQAALKQALAALPTNDSVLAAALRAAPVVLGAAGFQEATPATSRGLRVWPVTTKGADPLQYVRRYPVVLASLPELQAAAHGQGLLSADEERGVVRRVPLIGAIGDTLVPTLSLELLRVAIGAQSVEVETGAHGVTGVAVGDLRVPTDPHGEAQVHFSRFLPERYVSALDVMRGRLPADMLANKLAIVALTGLGLTDYKTTPRGDYVPGVEYHAQLIESFFDGHFLLRPFWAHAAETALQAAAGLLLIWVVPALRPRAAAFLATAALALLFAAGFAAFRWGGLLFDAGSIALGVAIALASLAATAYIEADRGRREAEQALRAEREAAARVAGELEAARRIQLGTLPQAAAAFPHESRFELASILEPARAVGGDLYDFFRLDERHVFVLIGDVSGKGVPASLFMSITKALSKSVALRQRPDLRSVLTQTNVEIARENPEALFVTVFAAVLDADSGTLEYWNAGHDAPLLKSAQLGSLESAHGGPPLGVLDEFDYGSDRATLFPGDTLVLFTDGVTEAINAAGEFYGRQRLETVLARASADTTAKDLLQMILDDLREFVGAAEPSDDVTLLVLRWHGPERDVSAR